MAHSAWMMAITGWLFVPLVTMTQFGANAARHAWLNQGDITVTNITHNSVVLVWPKPKDFLSNDTDKRFFVNIGDGQRVVRMNPSLSDPECSLRLSYCLLKGLEPDHAYSVELIIDNIKDNVLLGRAVVPFATSDTPIEEEDEDLEFWIKFVAAPAVLLLLTLIMLLYCARRCKCCCWRKKTGSAEHIKMETFSNQSADEEKATAAKARNVQRDRNHSLATRRWVKDTLASIDADPPTYDSPNEGAISPPAHSEARSHFYMPVSETAESTEDLRQKPLKKLGKSTSVPLGTSSGSPKKLKKMSTSPQFPLVEDVGYDEPVITAPPSLPTSPRPFHPAHKPKFSTTSSNYPPVLPRSPSCSEMTSRSTSLATGGSLAAPTLQQQLEARLQKQHSNNSAHSPQEEVQYTNTADICQLKGAARRMFPML